MILSPDGSPVTSQPEAPRRMRGQSSTFYEPAMGYAFEAARRSGYRGWFYFPTLEPSEMMPRQTREEIARKAWWLYNNVDVVRAVIDGLTLDEVDTGVWPKAATSSPDFNSEVDDAFHEECGRSASFHSGDHVNFYSAQWLIRRSIRLVGELFGQMLEADANNPLPTCHLVNAWQVGNATTQILDDQDLWRDGIYLNRLGRPLKYRFLKNREKTQWMDVSRENVLHFHDQFWVGQTRGLSGLAPVTRKLFSMDDIDKAETSGMLLRARLAYAITKTGGDGSEGPSIIPGASETEVVTNKDGTKTIIQKIVAGDGTEVDVADLPPNMDLKVIESSRASSTPEFLRWLLHGIGASTLYPPDYVFNLAGLTNGTLVRMVQKRVQRVKNTVRQFQLTEQFCLDWYNFWLWQRIKAGRFDGVNGGVPSDFLKHKIIYPADDTVDVGREGKLYDDRFSRGNISPDKYFGMDSEDRVDVDKATIAMREDRERMLDELNDRRGKLKKTPLTYDDLWPRASSPAPATAPAADPLPPDDPEDPNSDKKNP